MEILPVMGDVGRFVRLFTFLSHRRPRGSR